MEKTSYYDFFDGKPPKEEMIRRPRQGQREANYLGNNSQALGQRGGQAGVNHRQQEDVGESSIDCNCKTNSSLR